MARSRLRRLLHRFALSLAECSSVYYLGMTLSAYPWPENDAQERGEPTQEQQLSPESTELTAAELAAWRRLIAETADHDQ